MAVNINNVNRPSAHLILKLYVVHLFLWSNFPYDRQYGARSIKNNGKENKSE
jgi:hypothetical protein